MAWTVPRTWASGEIVTAANMNTHVRDNMKAVAGTDKAACRVNPTAIQGIPDATFTAIAYGAERFDTQTLHSTSTNNSRITIPTGWGGQYLMGTCNGWVYSSLGLRATSIQLNGTTLLVYEQTVATTSAATPAIITSVTTLHALVAGDYVEVIVYQNSGGSLNNLWVNNYASEFWATWNGTG